MTENEAIERLKCMRLFMEISDKQNENKFLEDDYIANKIAIQALEEIQQYRAIGTVEELQELKEKSRAKKIRYEHYCGFRDAECPVCGKGVDNKDEYCSRCGQKLDWQ